LRVSYVLKTILISTFCYQYSFNDTSRVQ
jgi:hypothetical protein